MSIHIAFSKYDDNRRFQELLKIPDILDKYSENIELTPREDEILTDFEIDYDNKELIKEKISFLTEEWIQNNPEEYVIYQWVVDENLKELLDTKTMTLETRMLLATQPEIVKLLQGPTAFDTGRIDGNFNLFLTDYASKKSQESENLEVITKEDIVDIFKKAIIERDDDLFECMLQNSRYFTNKNDKLDIIYFTAEMGRITYLRKVLNDWFLSPYINSIGLLKYCDWERFIFRRQETIFNIFLDLWEDIYDSYRENPEKLDKIRKLDIKNFPQYVEYLKLSVKDYLPNISINLLRSKIKYLDQKSFDEIKFDATQNNNTRVLEVLSERQMVEY